MIVYPIKPSTDFYTRLEVGEDKHDHDGGGASPTSFPPHNGTFFSPSSPQKPNPQHTAENTFTECASDQEIRIQYCPVNPCVTQIVHQLHMDVLAGMEGAEIQLNRCLTVCAFLEASHHDAFHLSQPPQSHSCQSDDALNGQNQSGGGSQATDDSQAHSTPENMPGRDCKSHGWEACIILDCMCGDPLHQVTIRKQAYVQQFRLGRKCRFLQPLDGTKHPQLGSRGSMPAGGVVSNSSSFRPLHIPLASLFPAQASAMQECLLPDMGPAFRSMLQKRFFSEQFKKGWIRAASTVQILPSSSSPVACTPLPLENIANNGNSHAGGGDVVHGSATRASPHTGSSANNNAHFQPPCLNAADSAKRMANQTWNSAHTLMASFLHDSIPCLKRSKRNVFPVQQAATNGKSNAHEEISHAKAEDQSPRSSKKRRVGAVEVPGVVGRSATGAHTGSAVVATPFHSQVDVMACVNVLFGTLLKLYSTGVKIPTFRARACMTRRLHELQSMPLQEQVDFLHQYPSLVRICFIEYSLNALQEWMPCERELFVKTCKQMETYFRMALCMCDTFRWVKPLDAFLKSIHE